MKKKTEREKNFRFNVNVNVILKASELVLFTFGANS